MGGHEALASWLDNQDRRWDGEPDLAERAASAGAASSCVAEAFLAGFRCALAALLPGETRAALCISEERGAHPKHLKTRLERGRLVGRKVWTTLGSLAETFLVAAVRGVTPDGRNDLVLVRVPSDADGVDVSLMPPTPFVPEIPHCQIQFDVAVNDTQVLPGAAWTEYIRPFRTLEDSYVCLSLAALLRAQAEACDEDWAAQLGSVVGTLRLAPHFQHDDPRWHMVLGDAIDRLTQLADPAHPRMTALGKATAAQWARDAQLLGIASRARAIRLDRARAALRA